MKVMQISEIMRVLRRNQNKFGGDFIGTGIAIPGWDFVDSIITRYADAFYRVRFYYDTNYDGWVFPDNWTDEQKDAFLDFYYLWEAFWNTERSHNIEQELDLMLNASYDPIENYNKNSKIERGSRADGYKDERTPTGTESETKTIDGKVQDKETPTGKKVNKRTYDTTDDTTNQVTTYDDVSYRNDSKNILDKDGTVTDEEYYESSYHVTKEREYLNDYAETTTKSFDNFKDETERKNTKFSRTFDGSSEQLTDYEKTVEKTSGNIGVVSTQNMMTQELEVRKTNLVDYYIDLFAQRYLFYI